MMVVFQIGINGFGHISGNALPAHSSIPISSFSPERDYKTEDVGLPSPDRNDFVHDWLELTGLDSRAQFPLVIGAPPLAPRFGI